jgi:dihydrolipoamide dehydrogenase
MGAYYIQICYFHLKVLRSQYVSGGENLTVDYVEVMKYVRKLRDRFVKGVTGGIERWSGTHLIQKYAKFFGKNTISLDGEVVGFEKAIIATGSSPILPDACKPFQEYFVDTNAFFQQDTLPKKMAVISLGVIGIELGQALHRLGIEVIGIGRGNIAGITDPDLQDYANQ